MTPEEAVERLRGRAVVVAARGSVIEIRDLHARCLERAIPALVRRPPEPGG